MANNKIKGLTVEVDGDIVPFQTALRRVNAEVNQSNQALKNLNSGLKLDPNNTELLASKQKVLAKAIQESETALKKFQDIQKKLKDKGIDETSKEYTNLQNQIVQTENAIKKFSAQLQKIPFEATIRCSEELSRSFSQIYDATKRISQLSVAGLFGLTFNAAQYETDVANIKKIVKDLRDETVEDLKDISIATSSSFSSIAEYATIAAALGVAQEDLGEFAQTMKDLETVTDGSIVGEDGAKMVARFLNVMNIGTDEVHNFGSALTIVEDKLAVTADEVLEISSRLGALSAVGNVTQHDIIGLGGVMMNLGLRVESSASAITRVFLDIENQVATTSDKMSEYAEVAGMAADEFSKMWDTNPMEAFIAFTDGLKSSVFREMGEAVRDDTDALDGFASALGLTSEEFKNLYTQNPQDAFEAYISSLSELEDTGESTSVILDELGLSGVRTAETLLKLAGNGELIREMIQASSDAWQENTELTEKASVVYETTQKQLEATWEAIKQAAESIGKSLLPTVKDMAEFIRDLAQGFSELPDSVKSGVVNLLLFGASIAPIAKTGEKLFKVTADITKGIASIGQTADKNASLLTKFVRSVGTIATTNPSLVALLGTLGAIGATIALYNSFQSESSRITGQLADETDRYNEAMEKSLEISKENYAQSGMEIAHGYTTIEQLEKLISQVDEAKAKGEETSNMVTRIQDGTSTLNGILGEQMYFYDETNNKIVDMNGNVVELKDSWAEVAKETQRAAFIEAYTESYYKALEANKALEDAQIKTAQAFRDELESVDDYYKQLFDKWQNADELGRQSIQMQVGEDTTFQNLISDFNTAIGEINRSTEEQLQNNKLIDLMENGLSMDTDTFLEEAQLFAQGLTIPESTLQSISDYDDAISNIEEKMQAMLDVQAMGGQISSDTLQSYQDELARLQEERALLEEDIAKRIELVNQGAQEQATTTMSTVEQTFIDGTKTAIEDPFSASVDTALDAADTAISEWQLPKKQLTIDVIYNDPGFQGTRAIYSSPSPQGVDAESRMARAMMPLTESEPSYAPRVATIHPIDTASKMQSVIDSMQSTLSRSEQNFDLDSLVSKALKNIVIEVNVNNDMDGRQIASQVSTIQGLKIKKQNS